MANLRIVPATELDIPVILDLIHALAEYEKLAHVVTANPERLRETLLGRKPAAEAVQAHWDRKPPMSREKPKRPKPRGESTDAEHWGGPTRMSDEGPVMGLEQRGRVRRSHLAKQLVTG